MTRCLVNRSPESPQFIVDNSVWRVRPKGIALAGLAIGMTIIPCMWFGDIDVSTQLAKVELPGDLNKAIQVSEVFAHGAGVIAIFATLWWVDIERRSMLQFAALMTFVSGFVANGMKLVFSRIRPHSADIIDSAESWLPVFHGSFWDSTQRSFPSGHSATAIAFAIGLSMVYPRGKYFFTVFAILACLQRIVSQAHYPSDVLAGIAIAFLCCSICMIWAPTQD